jgi:hypothetical protein
LVSPAYFGHNAIWIRSPDQKVDANAMARASFGKDTTKDEFSSALIYKLQKKKRLKYSDQSDADDKSKKDTSTSLQLLIIWRSNFGYKYEFFVRALLIKHSDTIIWDEDALKKLHSMHLALLDKGLLIDISGASEENSSIAFEEDPIIVSEEDPSIIFEEDHFILEDTWLLNNAIVLMTTLRWKEENSTIEITISEGAKENDAMEPLWVSSNM